MTKQQNDVFVSRTPRKAVTPVLLLASLLAAGLLSTSAMAQDGNERGDGPVVQTAEGPVRGFVRDGVYQFLGIPYAAPPVGALRWMPPQPVRHWHAALDAEVRLYDNYGILDQQAVLHWVQRNAAAFGGDPKRVALGGQSAGAQDTGVNQISPLSAGLFNRAIYESSPLSGITIRSIGLTRGMNFAAAAGCPGQDAATAACLRALSTAEILQLQGTPNVNGPYVTGPMLDGTIMPMTPVTAWRTGQFNRMPIMAGNVQAGATFGISITQYFANPQAPITATQYVTNVTGS